jgi:hypothetical protein
MDVDDVLISQTVSSQLSKVRRRKILEKDRALLESCDELSEYERKKLRSIKREIREDESGTITGATIGIIIFIAVGFFTILVSPIFSLILILIGISCIPFVARKSKKLEVNYRSSTRRVRPPKERVSKVSHYDRISNSHKKAIEDFEKALDKENNPVVITGDYEIYK